MVISRPGTRTAFRTRRIRLNGVVFDTRMIVSRQIVLFAATASQLPRAAGCKRVDQRHAQDQRRQPRQPLQQEQQRNPAQHHRDQQHQRHADKPAHRPRRDQHRADNDDQRHAQLERGRQAGHRAVPVAVMMANPVVDHGLVGWAVLFGFAHQRPRQQQRQPEDDQRAHRPGQRGRPGRPAHARHLVAGRRRAHDRLSGLVLKTKPGRHRLQPIRPRTGERRDEDRHPERRQQTVAHQLAPLPAVAPAR